MPKNRTFAWKIRRKSVDGSKKRDDSLYMEAGHGASALESQRKTNQMPLSRRFTAITLSKIGFRNEVDFFTYDDAVNFCIAYRSSCHFASASVYDSGDGAEIFRADQMALDSKVIRVAF